VLSANKLGLIC